MVAFLCCHPVLLSTTNTPAKHTRPWKRTDTIVQWSNNVQQTRSPHIPMNPKCHFVSTLCVLHKERKQELCNLSCQRLHDGNEKKQRHRTNVREVHSLAGACTGYQVIEPFKSTLFVSAWLLSCVVISGACPTLVPESQPHIAAASSSSKTDSKAQKTHINKQDKPGLSDRLSQFWKDKPATKAQLIEPCGIPHNHSAFQRRYFFIIARDCVLHLRIRSVTSRSSTKQQFKRM